jgi:hypothetical protein
MFVITGRFQRLPMMVVGVGVICLSQSAQSARVRTAVAVVKEVRVRMKRVSFMLVAMGDTRMEDGARYVWS